MKSPSEDRDRRAWSPVTRHGEPFPACVPPPTTPETPSQLRIMKVYPQKVTDPTSAWIRETRLPSASAFAREGCEAALLSLRQSLIRRFRRDETTVAAKHASQHVAEENRLLKSFVSLSEQIDYSSPSGQQMLTMLVGLSQFYSDNLSLETKKGKAERKAQGLYNGLLPFGLKKNSLGLPIPDPETYPGLLL